MTNLFYRKLIATIDFYISEYGEFTVDGAHLDFNELGDEEKLLLIGYYVETHDRDTSSCFQENKDPNKCNVTSAFITYLVSPSTTNTRDFITKLNEHLIESHTKVLQALINDRAAEFKPDDVA